MHKRNDVFLRLMYQQNTAISIARKRPKIRAAVGMGIPMGIPMGMGMVWVWGL